MKYKGVIWTDHIVQRMKERSLSFEDVYWVFTKPDKSFKATAAGAHKFVRSFRGWKTVLVAKKNDKGEWVMMTCWCKPDYESKVRKPLSLWQLFWKMIAGK